MKKVKKQPEYYPTKIAPIIRIAARMIKNDPTILDDIDDPGEASLRRLKSALKLAIPELNDKSKCPFCTESMAQYADTLDVNDALLVLNMARIVKNRVQAGVEFTNANKVRVSSEHIHHTQKCRTTKCSKLGLIAKAGRSEWAITTRGFEALSGKPVPKIRVTFRGKIIERPEVYTTFPEIFREHKNKWMGKVSRKGQDHTQEFVTFDINEWVKIDSYNKGNLI